MGSMRRNLLLLAYCVTRFFHRSAAISPPYMTLSTDAQPCEHLTTWNTNNCEENIFHFRLSRLDAYLLIEI